MGQPVSSNGSIAAAARPDSYWWDLFWRVSNTGSCMPEEERILGQVWAPIIRDVLQPSSRVLEIGAGRAWLSKLIALFASEKKQACEITASDLVDLGPDHAAQLRASGITWAGGVDVCALPYPDRSFDVVCGQWALEYAVDRPAALAEVIRVVRPGGSAVFVFHHRTLSARRIRHIEMIEELLAEGYFAALQEAVTASGLPLAPPGIARLEDVIARMKRKAQARGFGSNDAVNILLLSCSLLMDAARKGEMSQAEFLAEAERSEERLRLDNQVSQMRLRHALDAPGFKAIVDQLKAAGLDTRFRETEFSWQVWARKPASA